jgi:hypothetical protein
MATFNGARFVAEQLDSIAAQTLLPNELVVGDDGSSDNTLDIVAQFAARAPFPVTVIRNPTRLGAAENFLSLGLRVQGPIVALCDWDDVWLPTKLERTTPWFSDPSVGMVIHRATVVDEGLQPLGRHYPVIKRTIARPARRVDPWFSGTGLGLFRKTLLETVAAHADARPHEASGHPMDHDDWLYHLSGALGTTVFLAEDLVLYRQHGGSYMGAPGGDIGEQVERGLRLAADDFRRQAAMFRERQAFWLKLTSAPASPAVQVEAKHAAAWCAHLASLQDARATIRDDGRGRPRRVLGMIGMAARGGYRSRTKGGLGARALAADALSLLRGRSNGTGRATDELAARVAAERAKGRGPQEIMADLTNEAVPPLYGTRWTPEMIRDLVFQARRGAERVAGDSGSASGEAATPSGRDAPGA